MEISPNPLERNEKRTDTLISGLFILNHTGWLLSNSYLKELSITENEVELSQSSGSSRVIQTMVSLVSIYFGKLSSANGD